MVVLRVFGFVFFFCNEDEVRELLRLFIFKRYSIKNYSTHFHPTLSHVPSGTEGPYGYHVWKKGAEAFSLVFK